MDEIKSFVVYPSVATTYRRMRKKDPELALQFIDALFNYGTDGIKPEDDDPISIYMDTIFKQIEDSKNRYIKAKNSHESY